MDNGWFGLIGDLAERIDVDGLCAAGYSVDHISARYRDGVIAEW